MVLPSVASLVPNLLCNLTLTEDGHVDGGYWNIIREDQLVDTLGEQHSDL